MPLTHFGGIPDFDFGQRNPMSPGSPEGRAEGREKADPKKRKRSGTTSSGLTPEDKKMDKSKASPPGTAPAAAATVTGKEPKVELDMLTLLAIEEMDKEEEEKEKRK